MVLILKASSFWWGFFYGNEYCNISLENLKLSALTFFIRKESNKESSPRLRWQSSPRLLFSFFGFLKLAKMTV